jgi:proteic killer suppression protein
VQISYANNRLKKLLGSGKEVIRTFGPENGKRILLRLDQIASADNLADLAKLPQTRVHELKADRDEQISVDVKHPYRLLMIPDHDETPRKPDGGLDWAAITQVSILEIADTH